MERRTGLNKPPAYMKRRRRRKSSLTDDSEKERLFCGAASPLQNVDL
jgi:hypothetical protein